MRETHKKEHHSPGEPVAPHVVQVAHPVVAFHARQEEARVHVVLGGIPPQDDLRARARW